MVIWDVKLAIKRLPFFLLTTEFWISDAIGKVFSTGGNYNIKTFPSSKRQFILRIVLSYNRYFFSKLKVNRNKCDQKINLGNIQVENLILKRQYVKKNKKAI